MKIRVHGMFLAALLVLSFQLEIVHAQSTAFSYQGKLNSGGAPASGTYNLVFSLFNVAGGGSAVAGPVVTNGVVVNNGLFYVTIDFGAGVWKGQTNWLQIGVETNGATSFTTLAPRQEVLPVPSAIFADSASNLLGMLPATQLSGTMPLAQLPAGVVTNNESASVTLDNLTLNGTLNLSAGPVTINAGSSLLLYADNSGNFFAGPNAGNLTESGIENTAIGDAALASDTSGSGNTANGIEALFSNTNGFGNTANGAYALRDNTDGFFNTADGNYALQINTSGSYDTADGVYALQNNTDGYYNTADGYGALQYNTIGSDNVASGMDSLHGNRSGSDNTAVGRNALLSLGVDGPGGTNNIALGGDAGGAFTESESDNIDIGNDGVAGENGIIRIGTPGIQTAAYIAGSLTVYGTLNLPAVPVTINSGGSSLLYADSLFNFFAGPNAGNPPAFAAAANTAIGAQALESNTSGQDNTASGYGALRDNTSGTFNTANGADALDSNTSGEDNTANGNDSLVDNTNGSFNTANGVFALYYNKSGSDNTAIGFEALMNFGSSGGAGGTNNIVLGYKAGYAFTGNESSNIDIGNAGVAGENNIIRIGTPGIQTATYLSGTVYANSVALASDRNAKENFAAINPQAVLGKVVALPISEWNYKSDGKVQHIGPMAQDFYAAFGLDGADDKHISVVDENGVALAAIKGLNEKLEADNSELRERIDALEAEVKALSQKK